MGRITSIRATTQKHAAKRAWEIEFDAAKAGEVFIRADLRLIGSFGGDGPIATHYRRLGLRIGSPEDSKVRDDDCRARIVPLERTTQSRR